MPQWALMLLSIVLGSLISILATTITRRIENENRKKRYKTSISAIFQKLKFDLVADRVSLALFRGTLTNGSTQSDLVCAFNIIKSIKLVDARDE
jgi:hypothetical protein